MHDWIELGMIALVLADVSLLGLSLLSTCIRVVAFQGILLGLFAVAAQFRALSPRLFAIAAVSVVLKGLIYPWLLRRAVREAGVQREIEPFIGYIPSILAGIAMLGISIWIAGRLPLMKGQDLPLVVPAALMTMMTGLFLIVARKKALNQCMGYLVFENGIYAFGAAAVGEIPALVELGILLDAFVAVLVMGVAMYHINREFDHLDADRLSSLKG
jgi:hydrogenase-4 component E